MKRSTAVFLSILLLATIILSSCTANVKDPATEDPPEKDGCEFLGWEGDHSDGTGKARAVYSDEKNVFVLSSERKDTDTVKVKLRLDGTVKTCGFDLSVFYDDTVLELVSCNDRLDLDIVYNQQEKCVLVNYSSANDQTKKKDIIEFTFRIKDPNADPTKIFSEMTAIKEINGSSVEDSTYVLIDSIIQIRNGGNIK